MTTSIVSRQLELTGSIKKQIETGIEGLNKYQLNITSCKAVIGLEEKKGLKTISAELNITIAHKKNVISIKEKDRDLRVAIDKAFDKADRLLNKEHDKIKDHKKEGISQSTLKKVDEVEKSESLEDEIIPQEPELYKPMEVSEAIERLRGNGKQFYVFFDKEEKMRVIYKISENKFGLY